MENVHRLVNFSGAVIVGSLPMNLVAAGILPAVEPGLPARRRRRRNNPHAGMDSSKSGRQNASPLRQAGFLPLRGGPWKAASVFQPRIGTMNQKRRQAGRTPNALRVSGTLKRRGSVWSAWSLLPLFGSGSWVFRWVGIAVSELRETSDLRCL